MKNIANLILAIIIMIALCGCVDEEDHYHNYSNDSAYYYPLGHRYEYTYYVYYEDGYEIYHYYHSGHYDKYWFGYSCGCETVLILGGY
jgi:hypothetical protein